jgi:hypothetical protein
MLRFLGPSNIDTDHRTGPTSDQKEKSTRLGRHELVKNATSLGGLLGIAAGIARAVGNPILRRG